MDGQPLYYTQPPMNDGQQCVFIDTRNQQINEMAKSTMIEHYFYCLQRIAISSSSPWCRLLSIGSVALFLHECATVSVCVCHPLPIHHHCNEDDH